MANAVYPTYKAFVQSPLIANDVRAVLVDTDVYQYSTDHEFLSDIPEAARVSIGPVVTGKSVRDGIFQCNAFVFPNVSGARCEAVVFYIDSGASLTSRLVIYFDDGIQNLPVSPDGQNITFQANPQGVFGI